MANEKQIQFAAIISAKIAELFDEDSELDHDEVINNATDFFHALANLVPNQFTGEKLNGIQFNHLANQLVFQNSNSKQDG